MNVVGGALCAVTGGLKLIGHRPSLADLSSTLRHATDQGVIFGDIVSVNTSGNY